jgi:small redox-active disulfide protein 2
MKVQVLGTGCPKCEALSDRVERVVADMGLDCEIVKVTDINEIMNFGIMMTPGLAVDGKVKSSGKLPSEDEIRGYLESA